MMNKVFRETKKIIWLIPVAGLMLLFNLVFRRPYTWGAFWSTLVIVLTMVNLYFFSRRKTAEITDGTLLLYSGVGINDPHSLRLEQINKIERGSKKLLLINYDDDKTFSIEAEKRILDQMESDISGIIKQ